MYRYRPTMIPSRLINGQIESDVEQCSIKHPVSPCMLTGAPLIYEVRLVLDETLYSLFHTFFTSSISDFCFCGVSLESHFTRTTLRYLINYIITAKPTGQ